jgi:hypothetical protein
LLKSEDGLISGHLPHPSHLAGHLVHSGPGSGSGGSRALSHALGLHPGHQSHHHHHGHGHASQSSTSSSSCSSQSNSERAKSNKPHIKKPLNAFMLYMKEMRAKVVAECTLKESAAINQILGRRVSILAP